MISKLRQLMKKVAYGPKADSASFIAHLRKQGMRIGERCVFYSPPHTLIDGTRPWLIEIGDDVKITHGVTILTHGYDWSVLQNVYGDVLGSSGKVHIGNNVFIGVNSTILKGVTIGNNVIIGANSLVNHDIPDNCVAAGNPARVIMSLEDYYEKRKAAQEAEAAELLQEYRSCYGKDPGERELGEFFWLFSDGSEELPPCWDFYMQLPKDPAFSYRRLRSRKAAYRSMNDFINKYK